MTERLELRSHDRLDSLVLTFADFEDYSGAIAVDVELKAFTFAGKVQSVWFQRRPLDEFDDAFERFERERSGSVSICNLGVPGSGNEFAMSLVGRSGGYALLSASLVRIGFERELELAVRFDVDGGDLGQFIRDWKDLFVKRS